MSVCRHHCGPILHPRLWGNMNGLAILGFTQIAHLHNVFLHFAMRCPITVSKWSQVGSEPEGMLAKRCAKSGHHPSCKGQSLEAWVPLSVSGFLQSKLP